MIGIRGARTSAAPTLDIQHPRRMDPQAPVVLSPLIVFRALDLAEPVAERSGLPYHTYLIDLLYLGVLLEAFVLFERVLIPDYPDIDEKIFIRTGHMVRDETTSLETLSSANPLLAGVFSHEAVVIRSRDAEAFQDATQELGQEIEELNTYAVWSGLDLRLANDLGASFIPDQSSYTASTLGRMRQEQVRASSLLQKAVGEVGRGLRTDLQRLASARQERLLYLPPLLAVALDRAAGQAASLSSVFVDMRDEATELRGAFHQYEKQIRDDSLPLREQIGALNALESAVGELVTHAHRLPLKVSEWKDLADLQRVLDGVDLGDSSSFTKALLGKPAEAIIRALRTRRVSYLSRLQDRFLNIRGYASIVENTFGRVVTDQHVEALRTEEIAAGFRDALL